MEVNSKPQLFDTEIPGKKSSKVIKENINALFEMITKEYSTQNYKILHAINFFLMVYT